MRSKVVYVLGAGFSAPLGLPVMANFLNSSKDLFSEEPEKFAHFARVFAEIDKMARAKNYLTIDLFNIEQILSVLDMEDYTTGTSHRDAFKQYLADVITARTPIAKLHPNMPGNWHDWLFGEDDIVRPYCTWLAGLFGVSIRPGPIAGQFTWGGAANPNAEFSIVSLNYDMVLERCLGLINQQCSSNGDLVFSTTIDGQGLPLAKLHGSVEPLTIVPPTWQKNANQQVQDAWALAVSLLTEANEIRILGFSFPETDGYIKYLLSLGAMRASHLKQIDVMCLDPLGDVKRRYDGFIAFSGYRFRSRDLLHYLSTYGQRADERVLESSSGAPKVKFQGINGHHHRAFVHE